MDCSQYSSVFVTTNFDYNGGGGKVSYHEVETLEETTCLERILTDVEINPKIPPVSEPAHNFLYDYFVANELRSCKIDLAFFNGSPFGLTTKILKPAKILVDIPACNVKFSIEEFEKVTNTAYPYIYRTNPFLWTVYCQHIKNADVVLCPSSMSADQVSKQLSLNDNVVVIPHGCSLPKECTIHETCEFNVLHVGSNGADKGQLYLVKCWQEISQKQGFSGNLVMVGRGTRFLSPFGILCFERVEKLERIYDDCSIYVQPSVTEGFGLPVLEAMAHSKPVIVTAGAGVSELIDDGKNGFVVPIRDPKAIAEKIEYFRGNRSEIHRMGKNARTKAEKYSWEIIEKEYQKLIREVLTEQ
jgi:glycosyltransferase involved in cell wall biosynthesis